MLLTKIFCLYNNAILIIIITDAVAAADIVVVVVVVVLGKLDTNCLLNKIKIKKKIKKKKTWKFLVKKKN